MSDDANKHVLFVKKADSKKGSLWNKLTNTRIIKQHGGFDIPEGDLHAITKYHSPIEGPAASQEETKEKLTELEKEIQDLKNKDQHTPLPSHDVRQRFSQNPAHDNQDQDDDL
jgi:hypothetical protein